MGSPRTYLTAEQVADRYRVSLWHIWELARTCKLPHRKHPGRRTLLFDPAELDAYDDGCRLEVKRLARGGRVVRPVKLSRRGVEVDR